DVDRLAQVLHRHRGAFDVPPRVSAAPWAVPLHQVVRVIEDPQREIVRASLVGRMLQSLPRILLSEALPGQLPELARTSILLDGTGHAGLRDISHARGEDPFD